jgi:predicted RNA-binding Zn-ribbon protein involved in translation (DUF1610 family)
MNNELSNKQLKVCDECKSQFYSDTSKMENVCPECSHLLYGYENCMHQFVKNRCIKCYWDGSTSEYLKK